MDRKTSKLSPRVFQIGEKDVLGKQREDVTGGKVEPFPSFSHHLHFVPLGEEDLKL